MEYYVDVPSKTGNQWIDLINYLRLDAVKAELRSVLKEELQNLSEMTGLTPEIVLSKNRDYPHSGGLYLAAAVVKYSISPQHGSAGAEVFYGYFFRLGEENFRIEQSLDEEGCPDNAPGHRFAQISLISPGRIKCRMWLIR